MHSNEILDSNLVLLLRTSFRSVIMELYRTVQNDNVQLRQCLLQHWLYKCLTKVYFAKYLGLQKHFFQQPNTVFSTTKYCILLVSNLLKLGHLQQQLIRNRLTHSNTMCNKEHKRKNINETIKEVFTQQYTSMSNCSWFFATNKE